MNGRPEDVEAEPPKRVDKARRQRRLGAALRENLKRRKEQARGRGSAEEPGQKVAKPVTQVKPVRKDES